MRWITLSGPDPVIAGWYPTISRWDHHSLYVAGAHRWAHDDWVCIAPERITCYYLEAYDNAHEARLRALELDANIGLLAALGVLKPDEQALVEDVSVVASSPSLFGWLGEARRRLSGNSIPPR